MIIVTKNTLVNADNLIGIGPLKRYKEGYYFQLFFEDMTNSIDFSFESSQEAKEAWLEIAWKLEDLYTNVVYLKQKGEYKNVGVCSNIDKMAYVMATSHINKVELLDNYLKIITSEGTLYVKDSIEVDINEEFKKIQDIIIHFFQ